MKIGIITGASSGMGREFVKTMLEQRQDLEEIWLIARRAKRLESWKKWYTQMRFRVLPLDLSREEDIGKLKTELEKERPEIAVMVHSAGFGIMGRIDEIDRKEQADMVDVNCRSVVDMTNLTLPYMVQGGSMIYMVSASAFLPQPGFAVYAASKAFALSYVRALQAECRDLKITAVCPGAVKTEFFSRAAEKKPVPTYKKLVMADPKKVVKKAWRDNQAGQKISIYGPVMKGFYLMTKIIPHRVFLAWMGKRKKQKR